MTNIAMENKWPIQIDDVPTFIPPFSLGIFHGYVSHNVSHNQMVDIL